MRRLASVGLLLALAVTAHGGERVHPGKGSFPLWRALTLPTEAPVAWIVALPPRLAAVDRAGTLWLLEPGESGVKIVARYGEVGSPDAPPVVVRLGAGAIGVAHISRDGRLLLWEAGSLRGVDVGALLSPLTAPVPVDPDGRGRDELVAVGKDGSLLLIGNFSTAPRVVAHLPVRALPDARIAVGDLDGDGVLEAVVLSDPTGRYPHGILGDRLEATSLTVVEVRALGLTLRTRYVLPGEAVFEDLTPVLADLTGNGRRHVLLTKSQRGKGAAVTVLGFDGTQLLPVAETPAIGRPHRWTHLIGARDLDGDGAPEILAVQTPHIGGVLTVYQRKDATLVPVAHAAGYSSHAIGSRNQEQAVVADLDGNGRPEVVLPRQARDTIAGLELAGNQFVERWAYRLGGTLSSNLVVADLNGDGLLDLAVADSGGLHVVLSQR